VAEENGFTVCELFTGHGVGHLLHMPPMIMHHSNDYNVRMEVGNIFTIEPILLIRHGEYYMWRDKFTTVSPNNPSAQWEHTVMVTPTGVEVLTLREGEII
jgi:methionyl aminopeptidase